jgi:hypothetical protein
MIANARTAVAGLFHDPESAAQAVEELRGSGVGEEHVAVWVSGGRCPGVGELIRLGLPEEEARVYHAEVAAGRTLVVVQAELHLSEVMDVLARFGGYEVAVPA